MACQDLGLLFTTLLTAKSEDQLSSLLLAFNTFLESPRVVSFDRRNITAESSCFKDINVPDLPPGTGHHSCMLRDTVFEGGRVDLAPQSREVCIPAFPYLTKIPSISVSSSCYVLFIVILNGVDEGIE